jgi:hypothetical protein
LEYAWLVRLRNVLQNAGVSSKQVEEIISEIPIFCYIAGMGVEILVDQLKMFKHYLEANPADPVQCNAVVESYNKSIEYFNKCINTHEMESVQMNEMYNEEKLKKVL